MNRSFSRTLAFGMLAAIAATGCGGAAAARNMEYPGARTRPATPADVAFMTKMIPHHAQAVLFAGWAESHGASRGVRVFCERVVVGQRDEILTMRNWLRGHGEPVPPAEYARMGTEMGDDHEMMAGMLTETQLSELDAARGTEFDRLFLTYMIPHHEGAVTMVDELFASFNGAQDDVVFKIASDISADQTTEIERMQLMLNAMN
jgi:uncharacterized protein (DUF305 family)